jgi:hypothetical protein
MLARCGDECDLARVKCVHNHSSEDIIRAIEQTDDLNYVAQRPSVNITMPMTHLRKDEIACIRKAVQFRAERKQTDQILYAEFVPSIASGYAPIEMHDCTFWQYLVAWIPLHWRGIHQLCSILDDLDILPKELMHIIKEYVDTKRKVNTMKLGVEKGCIKCCFVQGIWRDEMLDLRYGLVPCVPAGHDPTTYLKKRFRLRSLL